MVVPFLNLHPHVKQHFFSYKHLCWRVLEHDPRIFGRPGFRTKSMTQAAFHPQRLCNSALENRLYSVPVKCRCAAQLVPARP
jgi:hypothetical protein